MFAECIKIGLMTLGGLFIFAVIIGSLSDEVKFKIIYSGHEFEQAVTNDDDCKARYTGESTWIDCDVFFDDKRLVRR